MTGYAGAAAIADEHDLVAGIMRLVGGVAHPLATGVERKRLRRAIGDLRAAQQIGQGSEILVQLLAHVARPLQLRAHFKRPMMLLMREAFSMEHRWPMISTLSAPTTLPMNPI